MPRASLTAGPVPKATLGRRPVRSSRLDVAPRAPLIDQSSLLALQAYAGNRAVAALVSSAGRTAVPVVQRRLEVDETHLNALMSDHPGQASSEVPDAKREAVSAQLEASKAAALNLSMAVVSYIASEPDTSTLDLQALRDLQAELKLFDIDAVETPILQVRETIASTTAFSDLLAACRAVRLARNTEALDLKTKIDHQTTRQQQQKVLSQASTGGLRHLVVAPPIESGQALGEMFDDSMKAEDQPVLRVPKKSQQGSDSDPFRQLAAQQLQLDGQGPQTLELLYVGGSHGGTMGLFEDPESPGGAQAFDLEYWTKAIITPLVKAGIKARYVVLDACHTGQSASVFAPLLASGGKIILTMIETSGNLLDRGTWPEVIRAVTDGDDQVKALLATRLRVASQSRTSIFGVYLPEAAHLVYDRSVQPANGEQDFQMEMTQSVLQQGSPDFPLEMVSKPLDQMLTYL